jgi:hypothetical protein
MPVPKSRPYLPAPATTVVPAMVATLDEVTALCFIDNANNTRAGYAVAMSGFFHWPRRVVSREPRRQIVASTTPIGRMWI